MVRNEVMGRVTCDATIENTEDLLRAKRGEIPPEAEIQKTLVALEAEA